MNGYLRLFACLLTVGFSASCTDLAHLEESYYAWDDRRVLAGAGLDDVHPTGMDSFRHALERARDRGEVFIVYAHRPGEGGQLSWERLRQFLELVQDVGVPMLTFPELHGKVPENRAGVALTFDDAHIDEWYEMGDVLEAYGARATFFVSRFHRLSNDENRKLHDLYEAGHAIESHGVNHKDALEFSRERSAQEYVEEEVIPSLEAMRADGFSPTTFAYPKGTRSGALDEAILQHVELVRTLQWSLGHPFLYNPASWE